MNIILFLALCTSLSGLTWQSVANAESTEDPTIQRDDDANLLMWQELKKRVQQIEKNRASDLKRIQKLETENKRLRADLDRLAKRKPWARVANATRGNRSSARRPRRSARTDSKEESVEFLPAQFQTVEEEETIEDPEVQYGQFLEEEEPPVVPQDPEGQQQQIEELSDQVKALSEKVLMMNGCCNRTELDEGADTILSADLMFPTADMDQLKERVHHAGVSLAQLQMTQYEMRDQQKWLIFQIEQLNNELGTIDEDRRKLWTALSKTNDENGDNGFERPGSWEEEKQGLNQSGGEASGELDASGWHAAHFVDDTAVLRLTADSPSPKLQEVERTAKDAFSIVTQLKSKLDVIEKDLSKTMAMFKNMEKTQLTPTELNAFTQTIDFVQEALVNVTARILENELAQEKQNSQVQTDLTDVVKRLRLLSLQTEKARHLAQVVKDHQMDHFSAIQQFRHDLNALETNVLRLGMKLTNFQTDVMNATLSSYKESNKDLQQDVQIADLYNRIDRVDGKFPEIHQTLKDLASSLRTKAERAEVKNIGADVQKLSEKFQVTTEFNSSIGSVAEAVKILETQLPTDCSMSSVPYRPANLRDGVYVIKPKGSPKAIPVYCQIDTTPSSADTIGWTVIQRRIAGREDFNRTWDQYRYGFGDPKLEYWIGNEYLHMLTRQTDCLLRIDVWDIYGEYHYAEYGMFKVASSEEGYRLDIGHFMGNLTDAMQQHNGLRFSAFDVDYDSSSTHCARYYASGWWFSNCQKANLNGVFPLGVIWFSSTTNDWLQLQKTMMKVRPIK